MIKKATRLEYPQSLRDQCPQLVERNVLDNMKGGNDPLAFIRQRGQVGDCITLFDFQTRFVTGFKHAVVEVYALRLEA